jgi:Cu(I)/Ag(I) efflux system membrane protein CusA/SilA
MFGVVDDNGLIILTYLENIFERANFNSVEQFREDVVQASLKRIRPSVMTQGLDLCF